MLRSSKRTVMRAVRAHLIDGGHKPYRMQTMAEKRSTDRRTADTLKLIPPHIRVVLDELKIKNMHVESTLVRLESPEKVDVMMVITTSDYLKDGFNDIIIANTEARKSAAANGIDLTFRFIPSDGYVNYSLLEDDGYILKFKDAAFSE